MTKISKDLYLAPNDEGVGVSLFSNGLGKRIIIDDEEIPSLIAALVRYVKETSKKYATDASDTIFISEGDVVFDIHFVEEK